MIAPPTDPVQTLLDSVAHHQAGRLAAAEMGYAAVLADMPDQPQALFFAGTLALRVGRTESATQLLRRSIAARPTHAESYFALGNALWTADDQQGAEASWHAALRFEHGHVGALLNLARAREQSGDFVASIAFCQRAVAAAPQHGAARAGLAAALRAGGRPMDALMQAQAAIALAPDLPQAHFQAGTALKALGRLAEAGSAFAVAIRLAPDYAPALLNLANTMHDLGNPVGAEAACRDAIAADPDTAETYAVLGLLLTERGQLAEAIAACTEAARLQPDLAEAHWNMGIAMLLGGDLPGGFAKYEWRKRHPKYAAEFISLTQPEWNGESLAGKRLLMIGEQGLGDSIMFARYAAMLAARGARVTLACDRRLVPLLRSAPGVSAVVPKQHDLPDCDFWVDQMSLPLLCGTTLASIPSPAPYLSADPERVMRWAHRLRPREPGVRRVGLVWAGNPLHSNDRARSAPAVVFQRLADRADIEAVSLQVGSTSADAGKLDLRDWSSWLTDYAETAALIANLDLVVTVDTSVAHLAAAMGVPTWILIAAIPDWRWLRDRIDTPWYDSARLFRQQSLGDWDSVMGEVIDTLDA